MAACVLRRCGNCCVVEQPWATHMQLVFRGHSVHGVESAAACTSPKPDPRRLIPNRNRHPR
eukprot:scaffold127633_cov49-Phaeocystis_antarctica.AAC.2